MSTDRHYSRTVEQNLLPFVEANDAAGLVRQLGAFSQSDRRTAGYILGERLLRDCPPNVFWKMTEALVDYDSRAFLITLMKTLLVRQEQGTASLSDAPFARLAASFNETERQKVTLLLLPSIEDPVLVERLFHVMGINNGHDQMVYLVRFDTLPCLFLLLRSLRYVEHDRREVLGVARLLMKRGTGRSFSLASIVKAGFGLDELKGTFSLRLQPFEVARLEQSYDAFCKSLM